MKRYESTAVRIVSVAKKGKYFSAYRVLESLIHPIV
jgi:hypothetical protein